MPCSQFKTTLLTALWVCCLSNNAFAQSLEFEWQHTGGSSTGDSSDASLSSFQQFTLRSEYQALLFDAEQRHYRHPQQSLRLTQLSPGLQYFTELNDKWAIWPRLMVRIGYEETITSDSLTYNPQLAMLRQLSPDITLVLGAGALLHTTENQYYPVIGLVLGNNPDSRWSGNLAIPQSLIAYRLTDNWYGEFALKWQTRYYQLHSALPDNAYFLKHQDVLPSAGIRFDSGNSVQISARLHYALQRKVRLFDQQAHWLEQQTPDSKLGVMLNLTFSF